MNKIRLLLCILISTVILAGCSQIKLNKNSEEYTGHKYQEVISELEEKGFTNIETVVIDDLTSSSGMPDGAVSGVSIAGVNNFNTDAVFSRDDKVVVTYHIVRRLSIPLKINEIEITEPEELADVLREAGFEKINIEEVIDMDPDTCPAGLKNEIRVNGKLHNNSSGLYPYNANVAIICHRVYEKYDISLKVNFNRNLLFSKYGVNMLIDGETIRTLGHGQDWEGIQRLREGTHTLSFAKTDDASVYGEVSLDVVGNTNAEFTITTQGSNVGIETISITSEPVEKIDGKSNSSDSAGVDNTNAENEVASLSDNQGKIEVKEKDGRKQREGFDVKNNSSVDVGGYRFSIPSYWNSDTQQEKDTYHAYAENSEKVSMIEIRYFHSTGYSFERLKEEDDRGTAQQSFESWFKLCKDVTSECIETDAVKGFLYKGDCIAKNDTECVAEVFKFASDDGGLYWMFLFQSNNTDYQYDEDFKKIVAGISKIDEEEIAKRKQLEEEQEKKRVQEALSPYNGEFIEKIIPILTKLGYSGRYLDNKSGNDLTGLIERYKPDDELYIADIYVITEINEADIDTKTVEILVEADKDKEEEKKKKDEPKKEDRSVVAIPVPEPAPASTIPSNYGSYVGNSNSYKFHKAGCSSVSKMTEKNKVYFSSRQEAISAGYAPCQRCHP